MKGLSIRLAENEEEALNMLFEVFYLLQMMILIILMTRERLIE